MGSVFNFDYLITHMIETITLNLAPHFFTYRSCPTDLNSKRKLVNVYRPDHHIQHHAGAPRNSSNLLVGNTAAISMAGTFAGRVSLRVLLGFGGLLGSDLAVRHFQFVCSICWSLRLTVA
jgi:hypothetical protein